MSDIKRYEPDCTALVAVAESYYESLIRRAPGMWDAHERIEDAIAAGTGEAAVDVNKRLMKRFGAKAGQVMAEAKEGRETIAEQAQQIANLRDSNGRLQECHEVQRQAILRLREQIAALAAERDKLKSALVKIRDEIVGTESLVMEERRIWDTINKALGVYQPPAEGQEGEQP